MEIEPNNHNKDDDDDDETKDEEYNDANSTVLWPIDEPADALFCAQGLINHSGVKGKTVFVTWNENYLINFVFKTSQKTQKTTLTKVRLIVPIYKYEDGTNAKQINGVQEEIKQITILEYNTLVLMHSGRIYYFSSVKTLQLINWLSDVRCISSNSTSSLSPYPNTFSLIRFKLNAVASEAKMGKLLCLEVFSDYTNFGKSIARNNCPVFSYDITFDEYNFFECHWKDDQYTVLNLYVTKENIDFLNQLANMGTNFFGADTNTVVLKQNQNIQIFTISGNLFILIGAFPDNLTNKTINQDENHGEHEGQDFQIQLLNFYTSNIEFVHYEYDKQLLIVLLKCGYIDVWYKSHKCNGALLRKNIQVSSYLHYDYCANDTTFYFVTSDQVIQLKISYNNRNNNDNKYDAGKAIELDECIINTHYKCISGIMACTWVQHMKHLICLSSNNIFYCLTFEQNCGQLKNFSDCATDQYKNLNQLYVLTEKRMTKLLQRSNLLKKLQQKPTLLHQQIEKEYQKQVIIAMGNKSEIMYKKFQARLEYSYHLPKAQHFSENTLPIQFNWCAKSGDEELGHRTSYYILIYLKLVQPVSNSLMEAFTTTFWYLHLYDKGQSIWLSLPGHVLLNDQELCFIATAVTSDLNLNLKEPHLKATTFLQHNSQYLCLNFDINVHKDQRTYNGLFTSKMYYMPENLINMDLTGFLEQFTRKINVAQRRNNFRYIFSIDSIKMFMEILQNLDFHTKELLVDLENDVAKSINFYFLGKYLITLDYKVSQRQLNLTSSYPNVLFYMKLNCVYVLQHSKGAIVCTDGSDNSEKLLTYILKMQYDMQRTHHEFNSSKLTLLDQNLLNYVGACSPNNNNNNHNNNSSLRLENLKRIYSKLRAEFYEIFR